jgi:ERCC4 domain
MATQTSGKCCQVCSAWCVVLITDTLARVLWANLCIYRAVVAKAIKSIVLVPFPITTHEEAMSLDGVGPYLAGKMMRVLRANGAPANGAPEAAAATAAPAPKQTGKVNNAAFSDALLRDSRAISLNGNIAARLDEDCNNDNDGMSSQPPNKKKRKAAAAKSTNRDTDDTNCPVTFAGGQWEAVLVLDSREMEVQAAQASMLQSGVECHVRSLPLGDMLWVARKRGYASGTPGSEVLLGYVVERKTAVGMFAYIYMMMHFVSCAESDLKLNIFLLVSCGVFCILQI